MAYINFRAGGIRNGVAVVANTASVSGTNYAAAINYMLRTLTYANKTNNTSLKNLCLLSLGAANEELGNLDIALNYYNTMMKQPVTNWGDRLNKTYLYNNIGIIFAKKEKFDLAIKYFNTALDSAENNERYTECKLLAYTRKVCSQSFSFRSC
jgi:tetratricopeptide (TPR) repeat protein